MIEIDLPNIPVPWAASRVGKKGHFNPRGKEKLFTQWQIKSLYRDKPLEGFVVLDLLFVEPVPASTSKKIRALMLAGEIFPTRCDNTNCQKFYEDCAKNILFLDDRYVVKNISEKLYGVKGCVKIKVYTLKEYRECHANSVREC